MSPIPFPAPPLSTTKNVVRMNTFVRTCNAYPVTPTSGQSHLKINVNLLTYRLARDVYDKVRPAPGIGRLPCL
jgi:hypothetical protein